MKSLAVFSSLAAAEPDSTGLLQTRASTKFVLEQEVSEDWCAETDFSDWTSLCEDSDPTFLAQRRNTVYDNWFIKTSDVEIAQEDEQDALEQLERHQQQRDEKAEALKMRQDALAAHDKKVDELTNQLNGVKQTLPGLRAKTSSALDKKNAAMVETFQAGENMRKCFGDLERSAEEEAKAKQDLEDDKAEKIVTAEHLSTSTKEEAAANDKKNTQCTKAKAKRQLSDDAAAAHKKAADQSAKSDQDLADKLAKKDVAVGEHGAAKTSHGAAVTDHDGAKQRKEKECSEARDAKAVMNDQVKAYNDKVIECDKRAVALELATKFRIDAKSNADAACGAHTAAIEANDGAKARKETAEVEKAIAIDEHNEWKEVLAEVKTEKALECAQAEAAKKKMDEASVNFNKAKQAANDAFKHSQMANSTRTDKHTQKVTECTKRDNDRDVQTDKHRVLIDSGIIKDAAKELDDATGEYLKDRRAAEKQAEDDHKGAVKAAGVADDNLNKANTDLKNKQDAYKKAEKDQTDAREDENKKRKIECDENTKRKELTDDHVKKSQDLQENKDEFAEQEKNLKDKEDCLKRCDPANKNKQETDRADAVISDLKKATSELEVAKASYENAKQALDASTKAEADARQKKDAQDKVHDKAKSDLAAASSKVKAAEKAFKDATTAQDKAACKQRSSQAAKADADQVEVETREIYEDNMLIREDAEALKKDSEAWLAETVSALQQAEKDYQEAKKIADAQEVVCTTKTNEFETAREAAQAAQTDWKAKVASEQCKQRTLIARTAEHGDEQVECEMMIEILGVVSDDTDRAGARVQAATNDLDRKTEQQKATQAKEDAAAQDKKEKRAFWETKVVEEKKLDDAFLKCNSEEETLLKEKQSSLSTNATQNKECQAAIQAYKAALAARNDAKKVLEAKEDAMDKATENHSGAQCKAGRDAKTEAQKKHEAGEADNSAKVSEGKCVETTTALDKAKAKRAAADKADKAQAAAVTKCEGDLADATKLKKDTFARCMGLAQVNGQKNQAKIKAEQDYENALCKQQETVSQEAALQTELQRIEGTQRSMALAAVNRYTSRLADAEKKVAESERTYEASKAHTASEAQVKDTAHKVLAKWSCALENDMEKCQSSWACVVPDHFKSAGLTVANGATFVDECADSSLKFQHCGGKCSASGTPDPVVCNKGVFSPTPKCVSTHDSQVDGQFTWDDNYMNTCLSDLPYGFKLSFTRGGVDLSCGYPWDGGNGVKECRDNYFGLGSGSKSPDVRFMVTMQGVSTAFAGTITASAYGAKSQEMAFSNGLMELDVTRSVASGSSGQWQKAIIGAPDLGYFCTFRYKFEAANAYA